MKINIVKTKDDAIQVQAIWNSEKIKNKSEKEIQENLEKSITLSN